MTDAWELVRREREALVEDLAGLTDEQWELPSLCGGWTVHDVAAHLVDNARTTRLGIVAAMVRARFDFDRQNDDGVAREKGATPPRRSTGCARWSDGVRPLPRRSTAGSSRRSSTARTYDARSASTATTRRRPSSAPWPTSSGRRSGWARYHTRSMRVLTITTSAKQLAHLKQVTEEADGRSHFWFTTFDKISAETIFTAPIWQVAQREGQFSFLR